MSRVKSFLAFRFSPPFEHRQGEVLVMNLDGCGLILMKKFVPYALDRQCQLLRTQSFDEYSG